MLKLCSCCLPVLLGQLSCPYCHRVVNTDNLTIMSSNLCGTSEETKTKTTKDIQYYYYKHYGFAEILPPFYFSTMEKKCWGKLAMLEKYGNVPCLLSMSDVIGLMMSFKKVLQHNALTRIYSVQKK